MITEKVTAKELKVYGILQSGWRYKADVIRGGRMAKVYMPCIELVSGQL